MATTLADSYLDASSSRSGSASELLAAKKVDKYRDLPSQFSFHPLAFENLGPAGAATTQFMRDVGRLMSLVSGDPKEELHLWQRLSVCLMRFNSIMLSQSFKGPPADESDE